MPQLPQQGQTERVYLPSTKDLPEAYQAWVILQTGRILGGDMVRVNVSDGGKGLGVAVDLLSGRIQEWNFTEGDGSLAQINLANVQRLEIDDITFLFEKLNLGDDEDLTPDQKKSSTPISEPPLTV